MYPPADGNSDVMDDLGALKVWFLTGSQHLYGPDLIDEGRELRWNQVYYQLAGGL